jgi:CBS domain-containing protein
MKGRVKLVADYMKRRVIKFSPEDSIFDVAKVLSEKNISGGPVVKKNKIVGVISQSDIVKFMQLNIPLPSRTEVPSVAVILATLIKDHIRFKKELEKISKFKVKDIMRKGVITISPDETILDAAMKMAKHDISRLLVVDEKDKLIGIITRSDLIRALLE